MENAELCARLDELEKRLTRANALVAMHNGLLAAIIGSLPGRRTVIKGFLQSTNLLMRAEGQDRFTAMERAMFEEALQRIVSAIDIYQDVPPMVH